MSRVRIGDAGLHVAGQADLERDPPVVDVLRELRVLDEPRTMTDSVGAAHVHGLPYRLGAVPFTGVHRDGEIMLTRVPERLDVARRRISFFPSGQIECHDAFVAELDSEPRHLE